MSITITPPSRTAPNAPPGPVQRLAETLKGSASPIAMQRGMQAPPSGVDKAPAVAPRVAFADGPIAFTERTFKIGDEVHTLANANPKATELLPLAGTRMAPKSDGETPEGGFIVQGPAFGSEEAKSKDPGFWGRILQRLIVRFNFGRASTWKNRLRLRDEPYVDYRPIKGKEIEAMMREWKMQPGDWLLVGEKHAGHLVFYAGDDADGRQQIVHSMATKYENRSLPQLISGILQGLWGMITMQGIEKTGVFQEGIATYFERHNRGTAIAQRDPNLTPEMRAHLIELVRKDIGKGYDGNLLENRNRIYCSELLVKNLIDTYKHFNKQPPAVYTIRVNEAKGWFFEMNAFVVAPENVSVCPDFVTLGLGGPYGQADMVRNLTGIVQPPRA